MSAQSLNGFGNSADKAVLHLQRYNVYRGDGLVGLPESDRLKKQAAFQVRRMSLLNWLFKRDDGAGLKPMSSSGPGDEWQLLTLPSRHFTGRFSRSPNGSYKIAWNRSSNSILGED
ncbi:MAG: hypothetical protein ACLPTZ_16145 [Beijerinckiaceae bacterium]